MEKVTPPLLALKKMNISLNAIKAEVQNLQNASKEFSDNGTYVPDELKPSTRLTENIANLMNNIEQLSKHFTN